MSCRIARWACCVLGACFLAVGWGPPGLAQVDEIAGPLELDGDIINGTDPGCPDPCPAPSDDPADWGDIFDATGEVVNVPPGTRVASFTADCVNTSGRKDCSVFGGGDKNIQPVSDWEYNTGTNDTPPKDDITNVYALLVDDTDADGEDRTLLYLGVERRTVTGSTHIDFDIKKNEITLDPPDGQGGPICLECPTSGRFVGSHSVEDILISLDFETGGRVAKVQLYEYMDDGENIVLDTVPSHTATICEEGNGGKVTCPEAAVTCADADGIDVCAAANVERTICGGPWPNFVKQKDDVRCIPSPGFNEVCIDVTGIPLFDGCISTIIVKSRSSGSSIDSALKDFAIMKFDTCSDITGFKYEVPGTGCPEVPGGEDCNTLLDPLNGWEIAVYDVTDPSAPVLVAKDGNDKTLENPTCTHVDEDNGGGFFAFRDLPNGRTYRICEVLPRTPPSEEFAWGFCLDVLETPADPPGLPPTPLDSPDPLPCDSVDLGLGGQFVCLKKDIALPRDEEEDLILKNFKVLRCVNVSGTKFCDVNNSGTFDAGDCGLGGFCIKVETEKDGTLTATSAGDGGWIVKDLSPNQEIIVTECEDPGDPWQPVPPPEGGQYKVTLGTVDVTGLDFANASKPEIFCPDDAALVTEGKCEKEACFPVSATNACGEITITCEAVTDEDEPRTVTLEVKNPTSSINDECQAAASIDICGTFPAGCPLVTKVTCTATTDQGLEDSCSFNVSVTDDEPPELTVPESATYECDETFVELPAECSDNCDYVLVPERTVTGDECETIITRKWTCTDPCGNKDEGTQIIRIVDTTEPMIECPSDIEAECDEEVPIRITAEDNCDPNPMICCEIACDPAGVCVLPEMEECSKGVVEDGVTVREFSIRLTAGGTATITCWAIDRCDKRSDDCSFKVTVPGCNEACSPGYWRNHPDSWCEISAPVFNPTTNHCFTGAATTFQEAFGLTDADLEGTEIDENTTLLEAVNSSGGAFNQTLFHCTAALLSAKHPGVGFPASPTSIIENVQAAFRGEKSFADAFDFCAKLNAVESDGGCPLN